MGIRIIRESTLSKMLDESYEKGLNVGWDRGWHYRKIEESNRGLVLAGYDMKKDIDEILKKAGL